jgi:uncharacterized membrane protein YgcG
MFSINSNFSISRLNNAEITAFYINVQKAITTNDPSKLGVIGILPAFGSKLQELIDRVYVSQGSEFTAAMKAADDRRCLIFRRIRLRLQMVEVAEQNEALLAIQDVVRTHLLSKYVATVTSKAYQERTSILQGFILDLNEKLGDSGIATLGLAEDITALEDANNEFIAAYAQRTAEKAEGNMGVTLRLRDEMYDIYLQMIYTVQYLANSTDEANAEKATACQAFIAHVNVLLSDAKKRLEQRLSGADTEEGEGGSNAGDEGGQGSNEGGQGGSNGGSNEGGQSGGNGGSNGVDNGAIDGSTENNGGTSGGDNGSSSGNGDSNTGGNSSDPNQPSEGGVVNGDEVSF